MTQTILVLGGSYGGLQIAHRLLKHTLPQSKDIKVILVSKNSHFFWNLASVRAIVPGILKEEQYTTPIDKGFAKYPAESFEFIVGSAEHADLDAKNVKVSTASGERTISYDHLVLATGSRTSDTGVPWKANGTHEEIISTLRSTADKVKAAKHIVVAGGGATGVEVAGELGFEFKDKEIILLTGGPVLLNGDSLASDAANELKKLGVKITTGAKVTGTNVLPSGQTEISLENGEKITTDLLLPTMGLIPNSEYLPEKVLTPKKFVDVDEFYKVKNVENVWAAGDIVWKPRGGFVFTDKQAAGVAKNIGLVLKGQAPTVVKLLPVDPFVCAVGRSRGVMRVNSVKLFSFMAHYGKGKTLAIQNMPGVADGSAF